MPKPYISRPKGSPDKNCMVHLLVLGSGEDAYSLYASASGENKWEELYEKLAAEADALQDAKYTHMTLAFADKEKDWFNASNFLQKFDTFRSPLVATPDNHFNMVLDNCLGDTVIAVITVLPLDLNRWCYENT